MAAFGYEAINKEGKTTKGSIEADSAEAAKREIRQQGLTLLELKEQSIFTRI